MREVTLMAASASEDLLLKRWTHSHEEDPPGSMVFRPADHAFPPSRGRVSYEFATDHRLFEIGIGPTDRHTEASGTWTLEKDGPTLVLDLPGREEQRLKIESLEKDRLVVRR